MNSHNQTLPNLSTLRISPQTPQLPPSLPRYDQMNSHNQNLPSLSTLQISPQTPQYSPYLPTWKLRTSKPAHSTALPSTNLPTSHPNTTNDQSSTPYTQYCRTSSSRQPNHHLHSSTSTEVPSAKFTSPPTPSLCLRTGPRSHHPAPLPLHPSATLPNTSSPHVTHSPTHQTQPTNPLHVSAPALRRSAHNSTRRTSNKIQKELDRHAALSAAEVTARTNDIVASYNFKGHNFFTHPTGSREKLRIWVHNLDGISARQPNSLIDDMILIAQAQVDIIVWQDPLISDDTKRTILPLIKTHWGGDTMEDRLWTGPRSMPKEMNHGVWVLVHSRWSQRIQEWITDPTGWARFGGVVLTGTKKSRNDRPQSLGIVSTYSVPKGAVAWNWLAKTMKTKKPNGVRDRLACDLSAVRAKYAKKHVPLTFMGDFNAVWNLASRQRNAPRTGNQTAHTRFWKNWSYANELTNAKDTVLAGAYTFSTTTSRGRCTDDKDFILSPPAITAAMKNMAVLRGTDPGRVPPTNSKHWPICLDIDAKSVLYTESADMTAQHKHPYRPLIKATSPKSKKMEFEAKVWRAAHDSNEDAQVQSLVTSIPARDATDGDWTAWNERRNALYVSCVGTVTSAEKRMNKTKRVERKLPVDNATFVTSILREQRFQIQQLIRALNKNKKYNNRYENRVRTKVSTICSKWPDLAQSLDLTLEGTDALIHSESMIQALERKHGHFVNDNFVLGNYWHEHYTRRGEVFTRTSKDKKVVCPKTLTRVILGEKKHSKPYARIVKTDSTDETVVLSKPTEVARELVQALQVWFGKGRKLWFTGLDIEKDSTIGRAIRMDIAQNGENVDWQKYNIPAKFLPILKHLKYSDKATDSMYSGCTDPITEDEWRRLWKARKKGTAAGRSGITTDMMALLPENVLENFRILVNTAWNPKAGVFDTWKLRVLNPIPKIPGNYDVDKARPIALLDVIAKGWWAIIISRITKVWEKNNLLNSHQYGSRRGKSATSAVLLATLLAAESEHRRENFYAFSCDVSKAYDSVETFVGKEMALRRLRVPERILDLISDMDRGNAAVVLTAFGASDEILGDAGSFTYERGWTQGGSESPSGWIATYDILLSLLDEHASPTDPGHHLSSDGKTPVTAIAFVDDALLLSSSRPGLELKANLASLYFEFIGIKFNPDKSEVVGLEWEGGSQVDIHTRWSPHLYDSSTFFSNGRPNVNIQTSGHILNNCAQSTSTPAVIVPTVSANLGITYLGTKWSPKLDKNVAISQITDEVGRCVTTMGHFPLKPESALYLSKAVMKSKFMYRAATQDISEPACAKIEARAKKPLVASMKATTANSHLLSTPKTVCGIGWNTWYDSLMLYRMECLIKHVHETTLLGALLRAAVARYELSTNGTEMIRAGSNNLTRSGPPVRDRTSWVTSTLMWSAKHSFKLHGDLKHRGSVYNDIHLSSLAETDDDMRVLRTGSAQTGCVWLSQMLDHSGNFVNRAGHETKNGSKSGTSLTNNFRKLVQKLTRRLTTDEDGTIRPRYTIAAGDLLTRGAVLENDTVIVKEFHVDGTYSLALAVIKQIQGKDCVGNILVKSEPYTTSSSFAAIRNCDGSHDRTLVRIRNQLPATESVMASHSARGTWSISNSLILPRAPCDESSMFGTLQGTMHVDLMQHFGWNERKRNEPLKIKNMILHPDDVKWPVLNCMRITAFWSDHTNQRLHNVSISEAAFTCMCSMEPSLQPPPQIQTQPAPYGTLCNLTPSLCTCTDWTSDVGEEFTYKAGSDGSMKWSRGTFAWIAVSSRGTIQGGAEIPNKHTSLHSFRTESGGILGVMSHLWDPNDMTCTVRMTTDNQTAADTYNGIYIENNSVDIWDEIRWWQNLWGERFVVVWKQGHPEKRHADTTTWSGDDWRNHAADRLCDTMYYSGIKISPVDYTHGRVWYWMHKGERVVDNNMATYVDILNQESLVHLSNTSNINHGSINWEHTGRVISHFAQTPLMKKSRLVRMFDRNWFHGHMLACGLYGDIPTSVSKDRFCPDSVQWLGSNKLSWCQSCSANQLENREHHLAVCPNPRAKQIRKDWLTKLLKYTLAKLPLLHARLQRHFTLHPEGHLTWEQSTNKASQILSGCVPRAWWDELFEQATASFPTRPSDEERASVDRMAGNYYKFLDWLKRHLPTDIWAPLREVRTSNYERRCDDYEQVADESAIDDDERERLSLSPRDYLY